MAIFGAFTAISILNTTLASGRTTAGYGGALPPEPPRKRFQHLRDWWPVYASVGGPLLAIGVLVLLWL